MYVGAIVNKCFKDGNCRISDKPARVISNDPNVYQRGMKNEEQVFNSI